MQPLILAAALIGVQGGAGPPIEGDGSLLNLLRSAQQTNSTLYPRGRLQAHLVSGWSEEERRYLHLDAVVVWDTNNTYCEYTRRQSSPKQDVQGNTVWIDTETAARGIQNAKSRTWYNPTADLLVLIPRSPEDRSSVADIEMKLRPQDCWFHCWGILGQTRDWIQYMGPHPAAPQEKVAKYVLRRAEDDANRIILEKHFKPGFVVTIEASLDFGGNVVAYSGSGGGSPLESEGRYEWARHPSGVWYVKKHEFRRRRNGDIDRVYSLEVTSFDPNPDIAPTQFDVAAIGVKPGTTVREESAPGKTRREYSYGTKPPEDKAQRQSQLQSRLDELSRRLGSKGFAAP